MTVVHNTHNIQTHNRKSTFILSIHSIHSYAKFSQTLPKYCIYLNSATPSPTSYPPQQQQQQTKKQSIQFFANNNHNINRKPNKQYRHAIPFRNKLLFQCSHPHYTFNYILKSKYKRNSMCFQFPFIDNNDNEWTK